MSLSPAPPPGAPSAPVTGRLMGANADPTLPIGGDASAGGEVVPGEAAADDDEEVQPHFAPPENMPVPAPV